MKLWLLDADVIIDFLSLGVFGKLVEKHKIYVASTVIDEVKSYPKDNEKIMLNFRSCYVENSSIIELSANIDEIKNIQSRLPSTENIDMGELESLAILKRDEELIFCTCDAAPIRALPFLDLSDRGISAEELLKTSGLLISGLKDRHTDAYFKNNLGFGQTEKIYKFSGQTKLIRPSNRKNS